VGSEDIYLRHRALIEQTIAMVCRRYRLISADAEDFASVVRLHLVNDDCAVLRRFEGRSSLKTFLLAVMSHLQQDWRNARWGKWRPSAEARRNGPLALHLERLIVRDGLSFDEAYETLRTNFQVTEERRVLEELAARFPARSGRQFISDEVLEQHPGNEAPADSLLHAQESIDVARRARSVLAAAIAALPAQDRLILKMRFRDAFPIVKVARVLQLEQKALYRRIERMLRDLRRALEASGFTGSAAAEILHDGGFRRLDDAGQEEVHGRVRPLNDGERSPAETGRTS
jgi:RNA polymerase sigma factor (sigma-70 family)